MPHRELDPHLLTALAPKLLARWAPDDPEGIADLLEGLDPAPATLGELLAHYDYGEPGLNGTLVLLAREMLRDPPGRITVASFDELPAIDTEGLDRFFHGDVVVTGNAIASDSIAITGSLEVRGTLRAGWLDAYPDLLVGGDLTAKAVEWMGLALVGGQTTAHDFLLCGGQGQTHLLGPVRTPLVLFDGEIVFSATLDGIRQVDFDDLDPAALAAILGVSIPAGPVEVRDVIELALGDWP